EAAGKRGLTTGQDGKRQKVSPVGGDDSCRALSVSRPCVGGIMKPSSIYLLSGSNSKVGRIHLFGLPPVQSCPGASETCMSHCYARSGRFRIPAVLDRLHRSWEAIHKPLFVERMALEIQLRRARIVRIHDAGDFVSASYIRKWARIIRSCPGVQFYCYTRSWSVPRLRPILERELVPLPNLRLWYSADKDLGVPSKVPAGVRVAYLQTTQDEQIQA